MSQSLLSRWAALGELSSALGEGVLCAQAVGLWGSSRALVLAALLRDTGRPILAIHASAADRHRSARDIASFFGSLSESSGRDAAPSTRVLEFPSEQPVSWRGGRHREHDAERALCCHRLLNGEAVAVMTTPAALSLPLFPPREFRARTVSLAPGHSLEREALLEVLERAGYERVDAVTEVGQWSLRGGIVDIFSPTHDRPVRVEFFGDEVESLRVFDPTSQRSVEPVKELAVLPLAGERDGGAVLTAYLPGDALVVLEDPALLDAPPDDAPSAQPLAALLADFQRLELPLLAGPVSAGTRVSMGARSVGGFRGQFKETGGGDPRLARRGLRRPARRGRRATGRAAAANARGARARGVAGRDALEPGGPRRGRRRVRGGIPASRARPRRPLRAGDLRRAAPAAPPPVVPARRDHRGLHRPGAERPRRPRDARHRPLPRAPHALGGWAATPTSCCSSTPTAAGSTCPSSAST